MMGTNIVAKFKNYNWQQTVPIEPLVWFRIIFGILITFTCIRFLANGWVYDLIISPSFHFSYFGWNWIQPLPGNGMYIVMSLLIISGIGVTLGLFYRLSIATFTILFGYLELIEKSNYLNHYYFIFLISFLLIWVPANQFFSLDVRYRNVTPRKFVSRWTVDIFKFQIGILYFFAGIAKINYYWLFEAQPLTNWLKHQTHIPLIGGLMKYSIVPFIFAWFGCLYDLCITFLLLFKKTRKWAYILVIIFHALVGIMFPIGVFPVAMILLTTIFFDSTIYQRLFSKVSSLTDSNSENKNKPQWLKPFLITYITIQLLIPLRHFMYPGELFWNEQGFRFSWRVMLIEKVGYTEFFISPEGDSRKKQIDLNNELSPNQIKMMSTQPDMILEFSHHLRDSYMNQIIVENGDTIRMGIPQVFVNSQVSLFNKGSRPFVKANTNLSEVTINTPINQWLHSYE